MTEGTPARQEGKVEPATDAERRKGFFHRVESGKKRSRLREVFLGVKRVLKLGAADRASRALENLLVGDDA